jgi:hypothetical protein
MVAVQLWGDRMRYRANQMAYGVKQLYIDFLVVKSFRLAIRNGRKVFYMGGGRPIDMPPDWFKYEIDDCIGDGPYLAQYGIFREEE